MAATLLVPWFNCMGQVEVITPTTPLPMPQFDPGTVGLANCGFEETNWNDKDWVLATSDHILRQSTCESLPDCTPGGWFDQIKAPSCYSGSTRYFKYEDGKKGAAAFTMAALGTGTFDGIYVKKGSFTLFAGSTSSTPVAEGKGPYFVSLQYWADASCAAFDANTLIVPGGPGDLASYSIVMGKVDVASIAVLRATAGSSAFKRLKSKDVVLSGDSLQVRIKLKSSIDDLEALPCPGSLEVRTFSSLSDTPVWQEVTVGQEGDELLKKGKEIRVLLSSDELIGLGLVSTANDTADEYASSDSSKGSKGGSNAFDSDAFDANVSGLASVSRGAARGPKADIEADPPIHAANSDFVISGGVRLLEFRLSGVVSDPIVVQDQADYFYFSGHGNSQTAELSTAQGKVGPSEVHWGADVDTAIIAGCSVLDINDYNDHYPVSNTKNPGLAWLTTGPQRLLGYNWKAPLDDNLGDPQFTAKIVQGYLSRVKTGSTHAQAWGEANEAMAQALPSQDKPGQRPYNCCMIDLTPPGTDDDLYWYFDQLSDPVMALWVSKPRSEW